MSDSNVLSITRLDEHVIRRELAGGQVVLWHAVLDDALGLQPEAKRGNGLSIMEGTYDTIVVIVSLPDGSELNLLLVKIEVVNGRGVWYAGNQKLLTGESGNENLPQAV